MKKVHETILHEIKDIKTDMNNMKSDMQSMKSDINDMKADIQELKDRTINIELTLENKTNKHIKWLADGHAKEYYYSS